MVTLCQVLLWAQEMQPQMRQRKTLRPWRLYLHHGWKNDGKSASSPTGTLVNCFHELISDLNAANLGCKNQFFNH